MSTDRWLWALFHQLMTVRSKEETLRVSNLQPANFPSAPNLLFRTNQLAPPTARGQGRELNPMCIQKYREEEVFEMKVKVTQSDPIQSMKFSGQNTGVGSHYLLQWIFPTPGSNQGLLHCRPILCQLSYEGSWCVWWKV